LGINEEFPLYIFISAPAQIDEKQSHNNRIALLGFTAGSIIHDFNNILMMIISNAEIIRSNLNNPEKSEKAIDRIIKASDRAGELINGIEKITRRDIQSQPGPVNIFKTVNETVNEFEIILSENMSMEKNIDENTAEIIADETEIYQLLMNLLSNSVKAVKQAGDEKKLKISLENFEPENFLLAEGLPESLRKGKYVKLSVSDSGAGIPRKTLEKIYEPFFTTALNGKGSGLGLAIVKDIVNKNKGEIIVNSTPGEGTVFNVYLPALEKKRRK
jgi:signal transduction histidine kinase